MDLIGGGMKNYTGFVKRLGDEKGPARSLSQIDFPAAHPPQSRVALDLEPRKCLVGHGLRLHKIDVY